MGVHGSVESKREEITRLCKQFRVQSLSLFGSAANGDFDAQTSDLDFLVKFRDDIAVGERADAYFGLLESLQQLFDRPVDLVTAGSVKNPYLRRSIDESHELLYAA